MWADAFLYNGEIEVLTLRLATLGGVVDRFIVAEATRTFRGDPKPLHYAAVKAHFAAWGGRIRHVILDREPAGLAAPFAREAWQRDGLARGFDGLPDDCGLLIGDVDEIPDPAALPALGARRAFRQALYYYDARTICTSGRWFGTVATTVGDARRTGCEGLRRLRDAVPAIDAGWHFSHTGGVDAVRAKLGAFSHVEHDTPETHAAIADRMAQAHDLFDRAAFAFQRGALADDLPRPLCETPGRWPGLTEGRWTS